MGSFNCWFHSLHRFLIALSVKCLLLILVLDFPSQAQTEPRSVCMDPRGCTRSGETSGTYISAEQEQITRLNDRFIQLLRRGKELGMRDLSNFESAKPLTMADLDFRVQRLYSDTFFLLNQVRNDQTGREMRDLAEQVRVLRKENEELSQYIVDAPMMIARARKVIGDDGPHVEWGTNAIAMTENAAKNSREKAVEARESVISILGALMNPKERAEFEGRMKEQPLGTRGINPLTQRNTVGGVTPYRPPAIITGSRPQPIYTAPPPLKTVEEKLAQIESCQIAILDARRQIVSQNERLGQYSVEQNELLQRQQSLKLEYNISRIVVDEAESEAKRVISKVVSYAEDRTVSSSNVYAMFAAQTVWSYVKEKVVVPRVRRFLKLNGLLVKADTLAVVEGLRRNPKKVISLSGRFKGMEDFLAAQEEILNVVPMFEKYASDAADALGSGTWTTGNRMKDDLFRDLGDAGAQIIKASSGRESETELKVRKFLFGEK